MKHIMSPTSRSTLTGVQEGDIQPNAVDLRLDKVFQINNTVFEIDNDTKVHRGSIQLLPDADGWFELAPGGYEVVMENIIQVGVDEDGFVITRSTLNRNDVFLTSGLYDTGYHGVMAACMHVGSGTMRIKQGTRIGQYLSFDAESLHHYDGDYGIGKEHDSKYQA
jgi:deoxycytidine triphosphate deaminase